jgi:hypothetical protein
MGASVFLGKWDGLCFGSSTLAMIVIAMIATVMAQKITSIGETLVAVFGEAVVIIGQSFMRPGWRSDRTDVRRVWRLVLFAR